MDYNVSSKVEQRGILAGLLLGKSRRSQNNLLIQHSSTQQDYILFKKTLLEQITRKPVSLYSGKSKSGKSRICLQPKLIPLTRVLVKKRYSGTTKMITRQFLDLLTPQGIAIWFMDQGSRSFKRKNGKIHAIELFLNTHLSFAENEIVIAYFQEIWGFQWGLSKTRCGYRLRMGTKEGKRFFAFLFPYIHPSMLSKLDPSYNVTATT